MNDSKLLLWTLAFLAWLATASPATAQSKDIEVVPANPNAPVLLYIRIDKPTVKIGDEVRFDFVSDTDGYVTLWDIGTSGRVSRIYPNDLGGDMRVKAGVGYGAGGPDDRFAFQVNGPVGMEDVYLVWTRTAEAQPKQFSYGDAGALNKDLAVVERLATKDWATAKVTFEISDDGRPRTASLAAPVATVPTGDSRVFILAMGANVGELTKTNADARHFADVMQRLFAVPANQVRVMANAHVAEFAAGMEWLRQSARSGDLVVIFFSGHGSTIEDDNGDEADGLDEVFVMYDVQETDYPSAQQVVRDDQFAAWVKQLPTNRVITFIDACHSGGLSKSLTNGRTKFFLGGALGRLPQHGWQQKTFPLNKSPSDPLDGAKGLIYAAAQENEFALEASDGGLFVTRFLQQVGQAQNERLADVFSKTQGVVRQETGGRQTPTAMGDTRLGETLKLTTDAH